MSSHLPIKNKGKKKNKKCSQIHHKPKPKTKKQDG